MKTRPQKVGLWLVGACGGVGSTVALGLAAMARRPSSTLGLVSALPPFRDVPLVDPADLVLGGHEIRGETFLDAVRGLHARAGLFEPELIEACTTRLRKDQKEVRPGTLAGAGPVMRSMADRDGLDRERTPAAAIERLAADISSFRKRMQLGTVVVVHVASSEPASAPLPAFDDWRKLQRSLTRRGAFVPTSSLYALAALEADSPYINFTPSVGIRLPALEQRARQLGLPYMGSDGKTGETLVKSALAPMFAVRHLEVLSWVGQNILGNRDGAVLDDVATRQSKIRSKDRVVSAIVGGKPTTRVGIEFVPSLDDWKVAWDYIHFRGFLNVKMSLQFTWQGSDSILAAPLVIDLARFAAMEHGRGAVGPMRHLAFFFKDPIDTAVYDLGTQWENLVKHVGNKKEASGVEG